MVRNFKDSTYGWLYVVVNEFVRIVFVGKKYGIKIKYELSLSVYGVV